MSDLPPGWAITTLGELGLYLNGRGFKRSEWSTAGRPIIRIQNLTGTSNEFNYFAGEIEDRYIVNPGDFLISWAATLGAFIWPGPEGVLNQHIFKVKSFIDKRFHLYLVKHALSELQQQVHGSGITHITRGRFDSAPVIIPPLAEQRRIVATLEDHLSRLDAAVAVLEDSRVRIGLAISAIYTAAVEGRLPVPGQANQYIDVPRTFEENRRLRWQDEYGRRKYKAPVDPAMEVAPVVPDGWHIMSLEAVTDPVRSIRYGILMPRVKNGGTVPYVEVKDLTGGTLYGKHLHRTSRELDAKFSAARLKPGDVTLAIRGSYERSAVVPDHLEGANVSRDVARIAPLDNLSPKYLHIYFQSAFAQRYFRRHARGVAVKGVNIASVRALPVVVPPFQVQLQLVDEVERQVSAARQLLVAVDRALARARQLRRSMLTEAFAGRLVPQDPDDEPTTVLLERIRVNERVQQAASHSRKITKPEPRQEILL